MSHAYRIVLIDINLVPARKNVSRRSAKVTPYNNVTDIKEFAQRPRMSIAADKRENQLLIKNIEWPLNKCSRKYMSIVKCSFYVRIVAFRGFTIAKCLLQMERTLNVQLWSCNGSSWIIFSNEFHRLILNLN